MLVGPVVPKGEGGPLGDSSKALLFSRAADVASKGEFGVSSSGRAVVSCFEVRVTASGLRERHREGQLPVYELVCIQTKFEHANDGNLHCGEMFSLVGNSGGKVYSACYRRQCSQASSLHML